MSGDNDNGEGHGLGKKEGHCELKGRVVDAM